MSNNPLMPVLFVGHGSPMNAIEDNEFSQAWAAAGRALPAPTATLCVSAHWETAGVMVNYDRLGPDAAHSIPTNEHYLPLLYALALQQPGEPVRFFAAEVVMGSVSMRSLHIG